MNRLMSNVKYLFFVILICLPLTIKGENITAEFLPPDIQKKILVDRARIWNQHKIDVCWTDSTNPLSEDAKLVKKAVVDHIQSVSPYVFTSWSSCDNRPSSRIQITVVDDVPISDVGMQPPQKQGFELIQRPTLMKLNFSFQNWGKKCISSIDPESRKNCIKTIAVHEFLHALGALHEQLQEDMKEKDPSCYDTYKNINQYDEQGNDPFPLTTYDSDSIMNYCRDIYNEPTRLSKLDKSALVTLGNITTQIIEQNKSK